MMRIRYIKQAGAFGIGDLDTVTNTYGEALIRSLVAERVEEPEGEAGESVGPLASSDPADPDVHEGRVETHTRTQPETAARRRRRPG